MIESRQFNGYNRRPSSFGVGASLASTAGSALVKKVVFESNLLPSISIEDPFGPAPAESSDAGSAGEWFLRQLKPKITVYTAMGNYETAPWGEPSDPSYFPFLEAAILILGLLAGYGGYKLLRGGR